MVGNKLVRDEDGASMEETNDIADGDEEAPDVDETKQGLELRKILPICLSELTEGVQITMPYTIAVYMVRGFYADPEGGTTTTAEETVAFMTGLLIAVFCAAQAMTSYFWGLFSDRYGRKPVVICSNLSGVVSMLIFGGAGSFPVAATARFLGGFFNFMFGALKSMMGETCSTHTQAKALGYLSLSWGVGSVLGPAVGGILAMPCEKYHDPLGRSFPLCGEGKLFQIRPFLLPCLVSAALSLFCTICTIIFLDETHPRLRKDRKAFSTEPISAQNYSHLPTKETSLPLNEGLELVDRPALGERQDLEALVLTIREGDTRVPLTSTLPVPSSPSTSQPMFAVLPLGTAENEDPNREGGSKPSLDDDEKGVGISGQAQKGADEEEGGGGEGSPLIPLTPRGFERDRGVPKRAARGRGGGTAEDEDLWWKMPQVRLTLGGYGLTVIFTSLADEVTPMFASTPPEDGGMGLDSSQLSISLIFGGLVLMAYALWGYPRMQRRFGTLSTCRMGVWSSIPVMLMIPVPSLVGSGDGILAQALLCLAMGLKNITLTNAFTSSMILVNNVAPPHQMGRVNGAGQMLASLARAAGPFVGGLLWGLSVKFSGIPGHQFLVYMIVGCGYAAETLLYARVHPVASEVESLRVRSSEPEVK